VKIKKCSATDKNSMEYWYKNLIGWEFEVKWETFGYIFVKNGDDMANFINKEDI